MQYIFLTICYFLHIGLNCNSDQFNLYHTNHLLNVFDRDCLYYFIFEDSTVPQFIQYCIRFPLDEIQSINSPHYHHSFTFEELHKQNISTYQLYTWSAPIDLIEHYQIYLDKNLSRNDLIFYNCTYPWFGTHCEYSFDRDRAHWSFAQQVELSFSEKKPVDEYFPENLPCYTHLICDRVGDRGQIVGACLDWREVCDGRINCLNSGNDEEHCWQLEINECDPQTEFRCHNGLCIPLSFLNDDMHNPDCLDRTDEYIYKPSSTSDMANASSNIPDMCHQNAAFKCEEHTRRSPDVKYNMLECGDGTQKYDGSIASGCFNRRDQVLTKAIVAGANASNKCGSAFECVMGFYTLGEGYNNEFEEDCKLNRDQYIMNMTQHCPPLIELAPIIFGAVRFVYTNNVSKVSKNE